MLLSEFLSRPVLSLNEGRLEGIIKNTVFDRRLTKAEWMVLFDENEEKDDTAVRISDIFINGPHAVVIRSSGLVHYRKNLNIIENNPINSEVFDGQGKKIGRVLDVEMDNFSVVKLTLSGGKEIFPPQIISAGKNLVIIKEENALIEKNLKTKKEPKMDIKTENKPAPKSKVAVKTVNQTAVSPRPKKSAEKKVEAEITLTTVKKATPKKNVTEQETLKKPTAKAPSLKKTKPEVKEVKAENKTENCVEDITTAIDNALQNAEPKTKQTKESTALKTQEAVAVNSANTGLKATSLEQEIKAATPSASPKAVQTPSAPEKSIATSKPIQAVEGVAVSDNTSKTTANTTNKEPLKVIEPKVVAADESLERVPPRIIADFAFLLGRRVTSDIQNSAKDVIIKKGAVVTVRVVNTARRAGKLLELTTKSKA